MKKIIFIFLFFFLISIISAAPQITIHSPEATSYNSTKILLNVSSNESVDFFFKGERGRDIILAEDVTELINYMYINEGNHSLTIWANNSNGEANKTIFFETIMHNPINITSCGWLYSSDTEYILQSNLYAGESGSCLILYGLRNISVDLNEYNIGASTTYEGSYRRALEIYSVSTSHIFNGTINGSAANHYSSYGSCRFTEVIGADASKTKFSDLNISGFIGISAWNLNDFIFENVHINSSLGLWYYTLKNSYFIDSSIRWNGVHPCSAMRPTATAFYDQSVFSEVYLEETDLIGFPENDFYLENTLLDVYLRNSNINLSKIRYSTYDADTRVYTQHLLKINVTDQFNETGSGVIEIKDNGLLSNGEEIFNLLENPTKNLLIATEEDGTADVWVAEKLTYAKSSSPPVISEYDFSLYELTAKTWNSNTTTQINLTGHQSTIPIKFDIIVPGGALPPCTIEQMLDLNNDGFVDHDDAIIILRYLAGWSTEIIEAKECTGINLNLAGNPAGN